MMTYRAFAWVLSLVGLLHTGCSHECQQVLLTLSGTPAETKEIVVQAALAGRQAMMSQSYSERLDKIALQIPKESKGKMLISLSALSAQGCEIATSVIEVDVDPQSCLSQREASFGKDSRPVWIRADAPADTQEVRVVYGFDSTSTSATRTLSPGLVSLLPLPWNLPASTSLYTEAIGTKEGKQCVLGRAETNLASTSCKPLSPVTVMVPDLGEERLCHCTDTWCLELPKEPEADYWDVHTVGDETYAVGAGGVIQKKVGSGPWTRVPVEGHPKEDLRGVWGNEVLGVWAVGRKGVVLRKTEGEIAFRRVTEVQGTHDWNGVSGAGTTLWIVGDRGAAQRYVQGRGFLEEGRMLPAETGQPLQGVYVASADEAWVVGGGYNEYTRRWGSIVLHWKSPSWSTETSPATIHPLRRVIRTGGTLWAVGGCVRAERELVTMQCPTAGTPMLLRSAGNGAWSQVALPTLVGGNEVTAAGVASVGDEILVTGGELGRNTGALWRCTNVGACGVPTWLPAQGFLRAVAAESNSEAVLVGDGGTLTTWKGGAVDPPQARPLVRLGFEAILARSASDVWALGRRENAGELWHFNGRIWRRLKLVGKGLCPGEQVCPLGAIAENDRGIWLAGAKGSLYLIDKPMVGDQLELTLKPTSVTTDLKGLWAKGTEVFAVGGGSTLGVPGGTPEVLRNQEVQKFPSPNKLPQFLSRGTVLAIWGEDLSELWLSWSEEAGNYQGAVGFFKGGDLMSLRYVGDPENWAFRLSGKSAADPRDTLILAPGDDHQRNKAEVVRLNGLERQATPVVTRAADGYYGAWVRNLKESWMVGGNGFTHKKLVGDYASLIDFYRGSGPTVAEQSPTNRNLNSVSGIGLGNVWAVGDGVILRRRLPPP